VGYGDISPKNSAERVIAIAVMLIGQLILAKVFADLNWITSTSNYLYTEQLARTTQIYVREEEEIGEVLEFDIVKKIVNLIAQFFIHSNSSCTMYKKAYVPTKTYIPKKNHSPP
jgi:hypothetical protein